jgi:uncharacterized protein (DUF427 family)
VKAIWENTVIAESNDTVMVEGNHYFPPGSVNRVHLRDSDTHSVCHWKGIASYYDVVIGGKVNRDAAWYYPTTKGAAENITGYVAFWNGVQVSG